MKVENNMKLVKLFCVFLMLATGTSAKTNDVVWSEIDDTKMNRVNAPFEREAAFRFVIVTSEFQLHRRRRK